LRVFNNLQVPFMTASAIGLGFILAAAVAGAAPSADRVFVPWSLLGAPAGPFSVLTTAPDHQGAHRAVELHSTRDPQSKDFGIAYTVISPKAYRGHRIRVRCLAKAVAVGQVAALFVRSAPESADQNALEGTRSSSLGGPQWHPLDVVIDVAPQDDALVIGLVLRGAGDIIAEPPTISIVGLDVALSRSATGGDKPAGLDFEPDATEPSDNP
jgi:hypothetical protein